MASSLSVDLLCACCAAQWRCSGIRASSAHCRLAAHERRDLAPGMRCCCHAGLRRAVITISCALAAVALVYAFAAALSRPHELPLVPAAAPAEPPAELATILPCTPQQPVLIFGGSALACESACTCWNCKPRPLTLS